MKNYNARDNETRPVREREIYSKKVPLKLSNGIVGMPSSEVEEQMWIDAQGQQGPTSLDIYRTNKGTSSLFNRTSGRELSGKYPAKKTSLTGYL